MNKTKKSLLIIGFFFLVFITNMVNAEIDKVFYKTWNNNYNLCNITQEIFRTRIETSLPMYNLEILVGGTPVGTDYLGTENVSLFLFSGSFNGGNSSNIFGTFLFEGSGISGTLEGSTYDFGSETVLKGTMVGASKNTDFKSIIQLKVLNDLSGCAMDIYSTEANYDQRISSIESNISILQLWQQTIDDWKDSITDTITNILDQITGNTEQIEQYDKRLYNLEDNAEELEGRVRTLETGSSEIFPSYLNKLSSSYRKKIVCAYGEENHLIGVEGLGWTCGLTYKTSRSGRESVRCRCKRIR